MDYILALDANGDIQKLAAQVVDTDKKSSVITVNNQLDQPVTNQQLVNAINSGLLNQETIDAIRYGLATESTLSNFVESLTVTNDGLLVKFVKQDLEFTSDKVDVSGSNIVVTNDSNSPIPISDNGQSITVDGEVELGSTTLTALENITVSVSGSVEVNNDTGNPIPVSLQDVSTSTKQDEIKGLIGAITETLPSTDTASSGLNGRLQRIAQRITSLITLLPSSLGAKTKDLSFPVTLSTDGVASGIAGQIGEVQTNPAANTVLARLKTIADYLTVGGIKPPANSLSVTQAYASTSTLSNVASSVSSVTLLAVNNNRKTAIIYNDSTSILYVCLNASVASITNYSLKLQPDGNTIIKGDDYSGEIRGIWASANGFARITEVI